MDQNHASLCPSCCSGDDDGLYCGPCGHCRHRPKTFCTRQHCKPPADLVTICVWLEPRKSGCPAVRCRACRAGCGESVDPSHTTCWARGSADAHGLRHVGRARQVVQDTRGHWLPHLQPLTWSLQLCVRTPMARSSAKRRSGSCWALHHKVRSGKEHTRSLAATPETVDLIAARVTLTFRICLLAKWRSG